MGDVPRSGRNASCPEHGFEVARGRRAVPVLIEAGPEPGEGIVDFEVEAVLCGHGDVSACWPVEARYRLEVAAVGEAAMAVAVTIPLPDPR